MPLYFCEICNFSTKLKSNYTSHNNTKKHCKNVEKYSNNRTSITTEDIRNVAKQVLEHRLILNFKAEAENVKPTDIVDRLIQTVKEK